MSMPSLICVWFRVYDPKEVYVANGEALLEHDRTGSDRKTPRLFRRVSSTMPSCICVSFDLSEKQEIIFRTEKLC
jgi:hypothetical protein